MLRAVFDTVVPGTHQPTRSLWAHCFPHFAKYRPFLTQEILEEVLEVLQRPEVAVKFRGLAGLDLARVLDIVSAAEATEAAPVERGSDDPRDDSFLGAIDAIHGDFLVSEDRDLQVLKEYGGAKIVSREECVDILERVET